MMQLVGDYQYSGAVIGSQKYSIVRNGDELQRVREVFSGKNSVLLWDSSMPMTLQVLNILRHEIRADATSPLTRPKSGGD